jgi:hypothetical protein
MRLPEKTQPTMAYAVGILLGAVLILIASPLATIWAINTLFSLAIPFTIPTWLAATWLTILLVGSKANTGKK